jgi:SAM-dependent methyltransferase
MSLAGWWRRARWRLYAPVYDRLASPFERGRRRAVERLSPTPGDRILLVGCGTGLDLEHMPDGTLITAIDVVRENVRRTAERADALGLDVETRVADAGDRLAASPSAHGGLRPPFARFEGPSVPRYSLVPRPRCARPRGSRSRMAPSTPSPSICCWRWYPIPKQ